jgi:hypothetical protein
MKKSKVYPEVFVTADFLERKEISEGIRHVTPDIINVTFNHEVLGQVTEIFTFLPTGDLRLHAVYPNECQEEEDFEVAKDYYNNFLLDGEQTYLDYFHPEIGYYLQSRNVETTA